MLMSILPGLRDFRVPLASGLIWLLFVWILVEPNVSTKEPTGVLASLARLDDVFGIAALSAAVFFVAYLVGILLPLYKLSIDRLLRRKAEVPAQGFPRDSNPQSFARRTYPGVLRSATRVDLAVFLRASVWKAASVLREDLKQCYPELVGPATEVHLWVDLHGRVADEIIAEAKTLAVRLRIQDKERLYQSYDQKVSEAEFRQGVAFPITALALTLSVLASPWWLIALVVPITLFALASAAHRNGMSELCEALVNGQIASTTVTVFQEAVAASDIETLRQYSSYYEELVLVGSADRKQPGTVLSRQANVHNFRAARERTPTPSEPRLPNEVTAAPVMRPRLMSTRWAMGALAGILLVTDHVAFFAAALITGATGLIIPTMLPLVLAFFYHAALYRPRLSFSVLDDAPAIVGRGLAAGAGALILLSPIAGLKNVVWLETSLAFSLLCILGRAVAYAGIRVARRQHRWRQRALLLGAGSLDRDLAANLLAHPHYGLQPVGMLDDNPLLDHEERPVPLLGAFEDLARVVVDREIDVVIVAFGSVPDSAMVDILRACDRLSCDVLVVPRLYELHTVARNTEVLWGIPLVRLRRAAFGYGAQLSKRLFDMVVSSVAMVLLSPVMLTCALLSRWKTGSVLFRQTRVGVDGRSFTLLKFCTLKPASDVEEARWDVGADVRVGMIGGLLRRTSLDELPQFWNVLRGDMSLVGPRPERPFFVDEFIRRIPWYAARHRVPAGLTGWAQIHGLRGDTSISDRARFDNFYIENWSLWGDVKILVRTAGQVLRATGR